MEIVFCVCLLQWSSLSFVQFLEELQDYFFVFIFYCISLAVLFTLAQSTVAVVGSCFSCAYFYKYIYIYIVGIRIRIYLQELPDGQRFNFFFLARNLYLCICLLVYCAAARQLCLLYLRSIEARNSILKHPNQAQT